MMPKSSVENVDVMFGGIVLLSYKGNPWLKDWQCRATGQYRESPLLERHLYY